MLAVARPLGALQYSALSFIQDRYPRKVNESHNTKDFYIRKFMNIDNIETLKFSYKNN